MVLDVGDAFVGLEGCQVFVGLSKGGDGIKEEQVSHFVSDLREVAWRKLEGLA